MFANEERAHSGRRSVPYASLILPALSIAAFFLLCAFYHFKASLALDLLQLSVLTLLPGVLLIRWVNSKWALRLSTHGVISLGFGAGIAIPSLILELLHSVGIAQATYPLYVILGLVVVILAVLNSRHPFSARRKLVVFDQAALIVLFVLLFVGLYNLQGLHYSPNGAIVTRGLFGVDLPFLAGEIHGIQTYGTLRDLHQLAQPWHYHEATYQLLALLPRANAIGDLSFIAPIFGYVILAFSLFSLVYRFTASERLATGAVGALFLVGSLTGTEQGSYALSPSFVFGSALFLNILLVLDQLFESARGKHRLLPWAILLSFFFIALSQTKISTYLVLSAGVAVLCIVLLFQRSSAVLSLIIPLALSGFVVALQNLSPNPLMPGGDFLIGAPLLGYANHIAQDLHIPVSAINPITHGPTLALRSLLIIPYSIFHLLRFWITDPRMLAVAILLVLFRAKLLRETPQPMQRETQILLLLIIPIGYLLPVLYSPSWYPLALSFYAPLVSVQSALVIVLVALGALSSHENGSRARVGFGIVGVLFLLGLIQNTRALSHETSDATETVSAQFVAGMNSLEQLPDTMIVATHRFDWQVPDTAHDESFYWYSALSEHPAVSEGAKYGSLLAAVADSDSIKGLHPVVRAEETLAARRRLLDSVYFSNDTSRVLSAVHSLRADLVVEEADGVRLAIDPRLIAAPVFADSAIRIWRVK